MPLTGQTRNNILAQLDAALAFTGAGTLEGAGALLGQADLVFAASGELLDISTPVAEVIPIGAGAKRPPQRLVVCTVEGEDRVFGSLAELLAYLAVQAEKTELRVRRKAARSAKRIIARGKIEGEEQVPLLKVESGPAEAMALAARENARFESVYWTAIYNAWMADEEEEEELIELLAA